MMKFETADENITFFLYIEFDNELSFLHIFEYFTEISEDGEGESLKRESYAILTMESDETWDTSKPYIRFEIEGDLKKTPDQIIKELKNEFSKILIRRMMGFMSQSFLIRQQIYRWFGVETFDDWELKVDRIGETILFKIL